jgi:hypothetical protein
MLVFVLMLVVVVIVPVDDYCSVVHFCSSWWSHQQCCETAYATTVALSFLSTVLSHIADTCIAYPLILLLLPHQVLEICAHFGGLQAARTDMMGLFVYDLGPIDDEAGEPGGIAYTK